MPQSQQQALVVCGPCPLPVLSSSAMADNAIKKMVSKKKRRFEGEGFNLDLYYVTDRVIAMGYPSQIVESMFRNSSEDVRR